MEYVDYSCVNGIVSDKEDIILVYDKVKLINEFFTFKKTYMDEFSILEALIEFSDKNNYNYVNIAEEFSEVQGFIDIVKADCLKNNIIKSNYVDIINDSWE